MKSNDGCWGNALNSRRCVDGSSVGRQHQIGERLELSWAVVLSLRTCAIAQEPWGWDGPGGYPTQGHRTRPQARACTGHQVPAGPVEQCDLGPGLLCSLEIAGHLLGGDDGELSVTSWGRKGFLSRKDGVCLLRPWACRTILIPFQQCLSDPCRPVVTVMEGAHFGNNLAVPQMLNRGATWPRSTTSLVREGGSHASACVHEHLEQYHLQRPERGSNPRVPPLMTRHTHGRWLSHEKGRSTCTEVPSTLNFENFALSEGSLLKRLSLRESVYVKHPE